MGKTGKGASKGGGKGASKGGGKGASQGGGKTAAKQAKKAKQEKLAERRAEKQAKRGKSAADIDTIGEDDLDAILEQYRTEWAQTHANAEERTGTVPSRRANATLTPCPLGNDLWLYGGEYFDGDTCAFYQDLFRYIPEKNEWRSYASATQPGPRSAHQMVATPAAGGLLWCFGGEFASTKQTSFHHYRDLWVYSIADRVWEKVETKVRPCARSGHRMAMWKHMIVLFGGFVDTGVRIWVFDTLEYKWKEIRQDDLRRPSARSGFSFLPTPEGLVLYGGYCKKYVKGQRAQGIALDDAWMLHMDEDLAHVAWTKRRRVGYAPNPPRSGCTMAYWANRSTGVLFGGVTDTEQDEESMDSTFWNDLYGYQLPGTGRWISLNLRRPKKRTNGGHMDRDAGDDDPWYSLPLVRYNAMLAVQRNTLFIYGGIYESGDREYTLDDFYTIDLAKMNQVMEWHEEDDDDDDDDDDDGDDDDDDDDDDGDDDDGDDDDGDDDDDGNDGDDDGDDDDGDDDDGDDDDDDSDRNTNEREVDSYAGEREPEGVETNEEAHAQAETTLADLPEPDDPEMLAERAERARQLALRDEATAFIGVAKDANRTERDVLSTPAPGEVLQTFYLRTKHYWASLAHEQSDGASRGKQLRRDGFDLAEKRYLAYKPILEEQIERIRLEADVDEGDGTASVRRAGGPGVESRNRR
ncbi:Kelch repeat-containing protein 3 [Malassezia sp. CBS 17886]|nr:Kelch repeat-containing protein 3 [Malassezia sp. CBS 17886]